ncbi:MAG: DUF5320 domain-containing protein [Patescibacteria group bacterium]
MPGFDGTGPAGQGSMTGRKMGPCAGQGASPRGRFGFGRRSGRGRGRFGCPWSFGFGQPISLEEEEKALEKELEAVRKERESQKKK